VVLLLAFPWIYPISFFLPYSRQSSQSSRIILRNDDNNCHYTFFNRPGIDGTCAGCLSVCTSARLLAHESLRTANTMNSGPPNASTSGGKSLNISSSHTHSPLQQQQTQQLLSPGFESGSRRSSSYSSAIHASGRNNQGRRKQHKSSRRPQLVDEDAMAESVSTSMEKLRALLMTVSGCDAKCE
jgi:hypothetical protein